MTLLPENIFHVLKASEGGEGQRAMIALLRGEKIPAYPYPSCYVGHSGIEVRSQNRRVLRKAHRLVFG